MKNVSHLVIDHFGKSRVTIHDVSLKNTVDHIPWLAKIVIGIPIYSSFINDAFPVYIEDFKLLLYQQYRQYRLLNKIR